MTDRVPASQPDTEYLVNQIAHALRNPIFAAQVQVDALSLRGADLPEARKAVETLQRQIRRIDEMIGDMLLYGRPASLRLTRVGVDDLAQRVASEYLQGVRHEPAEVAVTPSGTDLVARWDPHAVRIILERLLDNAVQHTPPPHRVGLDVAPDGRGRVTLTVRDEGEGIPEELRPNVFLPFFPQHRGRPGLGLPIALKFASLLGGTLALDSRPGAGTEVRVMLPLEPGRA